MSIEGLVSKAGVALGLQLVVAEVHDHGEGVEQPAADHAQLVVVQPQLLQPRHRREQRRGQRHNAVTCNIRALLERLWKVLNQYCGWLNLTSPSL